MSKCACGSGKELEQCCERYYENRPAPTCEALMRSRYSAYILHNHDYLVRTWHPQTRPETIGGTQLKWIGLEIVESRAGGEKDDHGTVSFVASFVDHGRGRRLHETSRFVRHEGAWVYLDGDCSLSEIGRNDPCPCGSGRKFKKCCGERVSE